MRHVRLSEIAEIKEMGIWTKGMGLEQVQKVVRFRHPGKMKNLLLLHSAVYVTYRSKVSLLRVWVVGMFFI